MQGIYRILNIINDKWYVGSAGNIKRRWSGHKRDLRNGHASPHLQSAFNKYGAENFILEILMEVKGSRQAAFDKEQECLDEWMPTGQLYNLSSMTCCSAMSGENNSMYDRRHTEESRDKMRKTWQEKGGGHWARNKQSAEHVAKRVESRKKSWTPEKSAAQSERTKACWADSEVRAHLTEWWTDPEKKAGHSKGIREWWTPERREAHGELLKQGWTPERRAKNGMLSKASWASASPKRRAAAAERMRKAITKPYPAFYNIKTKKLIPAGINLSKLCRGLGLSAGHLSNVATGATKKTRDGWRLVTEKELS